MASYEIHDHIIHAMVDANYIGRHLGYDGKDPVAFKNKQWSIGL